MRHLPCTLVFGILGLLWSVPCISGEAPVDFRGFTWGGRFTTQDLSADTLHLVAVADRLNPRFGVDLLQEEVTIEVSAVLAEGPFDIGGGVFSSVYANGHIEIHRDAARDHDYGVDPPNSTSPSSFRNGALCLAGDFSSLYVLISRELSQGALEGTLVDATGPWSEVFEPSAMFLSGTLDGSYWNPAQLGYDYCVDGTIEMSIPIPVICCFTCVRIRHAVVHPRLEESAADVRIRGSFVPCSRPALDPESLQSSVLIGSYIESFEPGSLVRTLHPQREIWRFEDRDASAGVREFELEHLRDGSWEYSLLARALPLDQVLLGDGKLRFQLNFADHTGQCSNVDVPLTPHEGTLVYQAAPYVPCAVPPHAKRSQSVAAVDNAAVRLEGTPLTGRTRFVLQTAPPAAFRVRLFDVRGRVVRTLPRPTVTEGRVLTWDGKDDSGSPLPAGIYLYRVEGVSPIQTGKLVVIR